MLHTAHSSLDLRRTQSGLHRKPQASASASTESQHMIFLCIGRMLVNSVDLVVGIRIDFSDVPLPRKS